MQRENKNSVESNRNGNKKDLKQGENELSPTEKLDRELREAVQDEQELGKNLEQASKANQDF